MTYNFDLGETRNGIFFRMGLDSQIGDLLTGKSRLPDCPAKACTRSSSLSAKFRRRISDSTRTSRQLPAKRGNEFIECEPVHMWRARSELPIPNRPRLRRSGVGGCNDCNHKSSIVSVCLNLKRRRLADNDRNFLWSGVACITVAHGNVWPGFERRIFLRAGD